METYGSLNDVSIITLAPEKSKALEVIDKLAECGITVALGHSMADIHHGEAAVAHGSNLITHLFNAMLPVSVGSAEPSTPINKRDLFVVHSFIIVIRV